MPSCKPMPKRPRIYLAGGKGDWRDELKRRWGSRALMYDPFSDGHQGAIYQFTEDDLGAVRNCDLVFGYCNYHRFDGMALEFGFAHALEKVIVLVVGQKRVPSMMAAVSQAMFTDLWAAVDFVEERYLDGSP